MNRRQAMATMAGFLAAFILPVPRRRIDLMQFCGGQRPKWDLRLPYEVEDWTYATDTRVCVRVRPELGDKVQHHGAIPPFESLSWNHDRLRDWSTLPVREPLMCDDSECPTCDGTGYLPLGSVALDCDHCCGSGELLTWSNYNDVGRPQSCKNCKGRGHILKPGMVVCHGCKGDAIGTFPSVIELDGRFFDAKLYRKVQTLGTDYRQDNWNAIPSCPMLKFRFDGGDGMMMGINGGAVARRLKMKVNLKGKG